MNWSTFLTILAQGMITLVFLTIASLVISAIVSAASEAHRKTPGGQKTIPESKPPVLRHTQGER